MDPAGIPLAPHLYPQYIHHAPYPRPDDAARPAFFSYSPDVIKHRKRTSRSQRKVLEDAFRQNPKPSQYTRKLLIHQTGMERRAIQVWFQNRRAKEKKVASKARASASAPVSTDRPDDDEDDEDDIEPDGSGDVQPPSGECPGPPASLAEPSGSNAATPSAHGATTPAETTATASSVSPPSSNYNVPSPPAAWRGHPKATQDLDVAYAMRRGSAPAPLGADIPRPGPYLESLPNAGGHPVRVAVWEGGTPPSPLSTADDMLTLRRGSLPTYGLYNPHSGDGHSVYPLPAVPADPYIRRRSLERSKQRLASHPYAWQVAAANGTFVGAHHDPSATGHSMPVRYAVSERPALPHANTAPPAARLPTPAQLIPSEEATASAPAWSSLESNSLSNQQPLQLNGADANGIHLRPRKAGYLPAAPRTYADIVPGPLPTPNFSFGTAPAPIPENDGNENIDDDETRTGTSVSVDDMHRFGSLASVLSTESSATSAWYSDVQSNEVPCGQDLAPPPTWQPDARRASCPVPFVSAFADLQVAAPVNNNPLVTQFQHIPISNSSSLATALDLRTDTMPQKVAFEGLHLNQPNHHIAEHNQAPYSEPVMYPQFFAQEHHQGNTGVECLEATPTVGSGVNSVYSYYQ